MVRYNQKACRNHHYLYHLDHFQTSAAKVFALTEHVLCPFSACSVLLVTSAMDLTRSSLSYTSKSTSSPSSTSWNDFELDLKKKAHLPIQSAIFAYDRVEKYPWSWDSLTFLTSSSFGEATWSYDLNPISKKKDYAFIAHILGFQGLIILFQFAAKLWTVSYSSCLFVSNQMDSMSLASSIELLPYFFAKDYSYQFSFILQIQVCRTFPLLKHHCIYNFTLIFHFSLHSQILSSYLVLSQSLKLVTQALPFDLYSRNSYFLLSYFTLTS